jgi:cyclic nucleotide gated channel alpha 3
MSYATTRAAYLDQGIIVLDAKLLAISYVKSAKFKLDVASLLPTDLLYIPLGTGAAYVRFNRLLRLGRLMEFQNRLVFRTRYPNIIRIVGLAFSIVTMIHWNACVYYQISVWVGLGSDSFVYGPTAFPSADNGSLAFDYMSCFYWSTMMLTTIGEMNHPVENFEYIMMIAEYLMGILVIATVVGNIGEAISKASADRDEFQQTLDGIKRYMELRNIDRSFERRVVSWFDYLWTNRESTSIGGEEALDNLPDSVLADIAFDVHGDTLRQVAVFKECETGLLTQLVLKLRPSVFGPGEYVCRKGDIGKELYIIKRGQLDVVSDDGCKVYASLHSGTVFGEISILNIVGTLV